MVEVCGGGAHSLALTTNGDVVAWGNDWYGQCDVPAGLQEVVAIAAGGYHSLALRWNGEVTAWGATDDGQADEPRVLPFEVSDQVLSREPVQSNPLERLFSLRGTGDLLAEAVFDGTERQFLEAWFPV